MEDKITKKAPDIVFNVGISPQIKNPKIIANTKAKYFNGVTKDTSENLYERLNHKFASPPKTPNKDNINKSFNDGIIQPKGIVNKLAKVIASEKYKEINHTGSVFESCLIVIATYAIPKQKIIGYI